MKPKGKKLLCFTSNRLCSHFWSNCFKIQGLGIVDTTERVLVNIYSKYVYIPLTGLRDNMGIVHLQHRKYRLKSSTKVTSKSLLCTLGSTQVLNQTNVLNNYIFVTKHLQAFTQHGIINKLILISLTSGYHTCTRSTPERWGHSLF